jgi:DNA processing protein
MKINSISALDSSFPERLSSIPQTPQKLYVLGDMPQYSLGVSIIGTRKPTTYGRQVTTDVASRLAEHGAAIISGLAHGIDGVAHEAALSVSGTTIAVLANGLDKIYPAAHAGLAKRMVDTGGAIISEYEPGTPPLQYRFLERNRLVSGLGDIVIVTEASLRSGTMNTVSHALEQGKDVYAVPGPITSAMSAGCNALIAQGATPIVSVNELIEQLYPKNSLKQTSLLAQNNEEQVILNLIIAGVNEGEDLQKQSALDGALFAQTMSMLEIRGAIKALGANRWGV